MVVLASPFDSIGTLALVVGVWLIVIGVMEVAAAVRHPPRDANSRSPGVSQLTKNALGCKKVIYYTSS